MNCGRTYISVILPLKLEWEPCYYLPEGTGDVKVGDRVKVPFAGKEYSAVVSGVGITPQTIASKIKPIKNIEEGIEPIMLKEIELWEKVAEYYLCTIGEVYKAAYPISKINLEESRAAAILKAKAKQEKIIAGMHEKADKLKARIEAKEELAAKAKEGTKTKEKLICDIEKLRGLYDAAVKSISMLEEYRAMKGGEATGGGGATGGVQKKEIRLNEAQSEAYTKIRQGFSKGKPILLHGVTGSGKTEIYIKLAQEAISKGKNVLYLAPEIALSRQLEDRLETHFGNRLMVFHSAESAASKRNTAEKIRENKISGENYIILGTRSSLFLPHHNLGLIIVDEEHDSSYKQDTPAPRYNGRDTALMLSLIHKSNILLGSATPSLEELYNCECGRHVMVQLQERYHASEESTTEIIDTRAEWKKRGMEGHFSRKLIIHIKKTLNDGGQVMILRSRRALSPALQCTECGTIEKCPHCNVSLSLHNNGTMVCHYCGYKTSYTGSCTKCSGQLRSLGAGTQKIEEEAAALFPQARIARLDSDTAQNKNYEASIIKDFSKGEIDILIGTQMLSKGFDFSNLRLVAVIAADSLLGMQDFRADEKALQLLEQFRGRCGRREVKGLFVIQTSQPQHPIYQKITSNETTLFNKELMEERRIFSFPPYSRIIEIIIKDKFEDRAERMACKLNDSLQRIFSKNGKIPSQATITGPYAPAVSKITDQHIRTIRVSLPKNGHLKTNKAAITEQIRNFEKENRYDGHIIINVDPS